MKIYSPAYASHIQQQVTTLAICWMITKKNGDVIRGTTHDRDITIFETNVGMDLDSGSIDLAGVYAAHSAITASDIVSSSDMSVDNMEVNGALAAPDLYIDISVADIESGLIDTAEVVTFRVNWQDPSDFQDVMRYGFLGEVRRTAEGTYSTEVRGLTQVLQQVIGRTCGDRCDVKEFGDARCKYPVEAATVDGTVDSVTSRRQFVTTLDADSPAPQFQLGKLTWVTGENAGFTGQVKRDSVGGTLGHLEMWEPFPFDVSVGDTFRLAPGCDRSYTTCRDVYGNLLNFRGPGIFTPGMDQIIRAP